MNISSNQWSQVLLRKGSSDLVLKLELSEDLVVEGVAIVEIGDYLHFDNELKESDILDSTYVREMEGNAYVLSLGEIHLMILLFGSSTINESLINL